MTSKQEQSIRIRTHAVNELTPGKVSCAILDNLVLSSAARLLAARDEAPREVQAIQREQRKEPIFWPKFDELAKQAFRVANDISSLAQLVEAVVFFDRVAFDISHANRWGAISDEKEREISIPTDSTLAPLKDIITPIRLTSGERSDATLAAAAAAVEYLDRKSFEHFLTAVSRLPCDGAFIDYTNIYYETGYGDTNTFLDKEYHHDAIVVKLIEGQCSSTKRMSDSDNRALLLAAIRRRAERLRNNNLVYNISGDRAPGESEYIEKARATHEIFRNMVAAYFYDRVAYFSGMTYVPHCLRSNFVGYDHLSDLISPGVLAVRAVRCLEQARAREIRTLANFYGEQALECSLPAVLVYLLNEVKEPREIIGLAVELREKKEIKEFREHLARLAEACNVGKMTISQMGKEMAQIEACAHDAFKPKKNMISTGDFNVSIGISGVSLNIPLKVGGHLLSARAKRHLRFLSNLGQVANGNLSLSTSIGRVFGQRHGNLYRRFALETT